MSNYEERLENDITEIRSEIRRIGLSVEEALSNALQAASDYDKPLAYKTILADKRVNKAISKLDRHCHYFVARHLPSAGHLRFISSTLRMSIEIERVGDYATTICREVAQLSEPLPSNLSREVEQMGRKAKRMLHQALGAFDESNTELAQALILGNAIESSFSTAFDELVRHSKSGQMIVRDDFAVLVIFNMLERVGDQAVNICEDVVFAVTGKSESRTNYRILFLDKTNACLGPMAVSIARKHYSEYGNYYTASINPVSEVNPSLESFMTSHGHGVADKPRGVDVVKEMLGDYYVIVYLEGKSSDYDLVMPFRTIAFEWNLSCPTADVSGDETLDADSYEACYKEVSSQVRNLIVDLLGEESI